jgi:hypothetical protein
MYVHIYIYICIYLFIFYLYIYLFVIIYICIDIDISRKSYYSTMGKKFSPPRMSLDFMPFVSGRNGRWQPLSTPRKSLSRAGPAPCRARPRAGEDASKYVMYPAKSLNTCQVKSQRISQVVTVPEYKVPEIMAEYIASENVRTYGRRYVKNEC